MALIAIEKRN